jgi:hypothetical protein
MVAALLVVCFGCYQLLSSATDLAGNVARTANEHAREDAVPRVLNPAVKVRDGVAVLRLRCDSDTPCAGIVALTVNGGVRAGTASYQVPANASVDFPVPVPVRATHAQATFTESSGATTTAELTLKRVS